MPKQQGNNKQQIEGEFKRKTEKAILIKTAKGVEAWIAIKLISNYSGDMREGAQIVLTVPRWIVKEKGLE